MLIFGGKIVTSLNSLCPELFTNHLPYNRFYYELYLGVNTATKMV